MLSVETTPAFEAALHKLMRERGASESEAILKAVEDAAATVPERPKRELWELKGWALQFPENPNPRFVTEDDLYENDL